MLLSLRLRDFRCFPALACDLGAGATLFIGDNAQGKTSILEAVCVLLRLQSPRTTTLAELVRFSAPGFGLSGDLDERRLHYVHQAGEKELRLDGEPVKRTADYLAASGLIVWMGNEDLQLVRGSGEPRRRYLDFLGSQAFPEYRAELLAYERALRARNRLLKDDRPDWRQIEAYTAVLVRHGTGLTQHRRELSSLVQPWAAEAHRLVSGRDEVLSLVYEPSAGDDFAAALAATRDEELRRRMTVAGPHRDDLALHLNEAPAARFASEGQQRTIALALKLAQARLLADLKQTAPLLLIDDVFGELDPHRRNALLRALPPGSQKLITTTHLDWMDDSLAGAKIHHVRSGALG